jgi:hypothetical protein
VLALAHHAKPGPLERTDGLQVIDARELRHG